MPQNNVKGRILRFVGWYLVAMALMLGVFDVGDRSVVVGVEARAAGFSCATVDEIPLTECEALVSLYHSTQGDNWFDNSNWLQTNSPCTDWYMVICNEGHVVELYLPSNHLVGHLPTELSSLTQLEFLDVTANRLTGEVPAEIGTLAHLEELYLACNALEGDLEGLATRLESLALFSVSLTQFEHIATIALSTNIAGIDIVDLQDGVLNILGEDNPGIVVGPCPINIFMPNVRMRHLDISVDGSADHPAHLFLPVIP